MKPTQILKEIFYTFLKFRLGFVTGHYYLHDSSIRNIKEFLDNPVNEVVDEYEERLAKQIGTGKVIAFAAGRMAFYALLKAFNVSNKDEVILTGFTCSVMPNAIQRVNAVPVYSDVDRNTFGSSAKEIEKRITNKTKMIVAQHSFGIPCDIIPIIELGKKYNIPVIEDCALTFDSKIGGVNAGNFGDAAIFSTDHTKPINTLLGGFLYTKNFELYDKIKELTKGYPELNKDHQLRIFKQIKFERKYCIPEKYQKGKWISKLKFWTKYVFLEGDNDYPYPAKFPCFLAMLGIYELDKWRNEKFRRKELLKIYIEIFKKTGLAKNISEIYKNKNLDIVPLRFVFESENKKELLKYMSIYLDTDKFWFEKPVICCNNPKDFGYKKGSCKIAEQVNESIINLPCVLPKKWQKSIGDMIC